MDWSAVQEFAITDTHLFVRVTALSRHVIPKRCLHDPGNGDRVIRGRMAAKVGANQPPTPPQCLPFAHSR
ncbi:MAG: YcxB family protein [Acidimicrobiales bacterium]